MPRRPTDERIKRLEARKPQGKAEPPVVVGLPGELPSESAARLVAEGRKAPVLIVPHPPTREEWERQVARYQDWLIRRTGDQPPAADIKRDRTRLQDVTWWRDDADLK